MFTVTRLKAGVCIACGRETDCFEVACERQGLRGLLCLPDFRRQLKIASAGPPRRGESGDVSEARGAEPGEDRPTGERC